MLQLQMQVDRAQGQHREGPDTQLHDPILSDDSTRY